MFFNVGKGVEETEQARPLMLHNLSDQMWDHLAAEY